MFTRREKFVVEEGDFGGRSPHRVSSTGCGGSCQWGVTVRIPGYFGVPTSLVNPYIKGGPRLKWGV